MFGADDTAAVAVPVGRRARRGDRTIPTGIERIADTHNNVRRHASRLRLSLVTEWNRFALGNK